MSTGLSLHMDYLQQGAYAMANLGDPASTINHASFSLTWTAKHQYRIFRNTAMQSKYHAGINFFGVAQFFCPEDWREYRNYGFGLTGKGSFALDFNRKGRLDFDFFHSFMRNYPGTSTLSRGFVFWQLLDLTYSHFITKHFSLGIGCAVSMERGFFDGYPNTNKNNELVKLFVSWNL